MKKKQRAMAEAFAKTYGPDNEVWAPGNCYAGAGWFMADPFNDERAKLIEPVLCHGMPMLQRPPFLRFGHAWVEHTVEVGNGHKVVVVIDRTNTATGMPRELYYKLGKIEEQHVVRYTHEQTRVQACAFGHWGPWETKFLSAEFSDG